MVTNSNRALGWLFALILILCSSFAHSQNARWDLGAPGSAGAVTFSGSGLAYLVAQPNVTLAWCNYPANAVPCTNYANTYPSLSSASPCPTNAQIVLQGSNTCQATSDTFGDMGVYTPPGIYSYTLTVNGVSYGPYVTTVAVGSPGGTSCELEANDSGSFAGVPNSCANFTSGNISSTAGLSFGTLNATSTSSAAEFLSNSLNPANAGAVALANADQILWRNDANNANEGLGVDSSDRANASFAGGFGLTGATAKLWFGGFTSSYPMLKPVSTGLTLRLGDDSGDGGPFEALSFKVAGSQAITGVQGSTGTNFFVCTGSFTSGHLVKVDSNGNCADSGAAAPTQIQTNNSTTTTCPTGNSGGDTCTFTMTWGTSFADTNYSLSCIGAGTVTGFPFIQAASKTDGGATITVTNGTSNEGVISGYSEMDCIAIHP